MKITYKQILATIAAILTVVGLVYGMNEFFMPRETGELLFAGLQKGQQDLNRQYRVQDAMAWYQYYSVEVQRLSAECARDPNNQYKRNYLMQMIKLRDNAKRELEELMRLK